ncbi:hypothetical protein O9929_23670 [Vibrio lentus]|nr:hypothetical protein [Vibrio lentus]
MTSLSGRPQELDLDKHQTVRDGKLLKLSPVCWQILVMLVKQPERVLSKAKLEEAWEDEMRKL